MLSELLQGTDTGAVVIIQGKYLKVVEHDKKLLSVMMTRIYALIDSCGYSGQHLLQSFISAALNRYVRKLVWGLWLLVYLLLSKKCV